MTIAVTAASGQLGRAIVQELVRMAIDEPVVALARTPHKASDLGVAVRLGDYDQPEQLRESLSGVDTLLLVSGMAPPDARVQQHRNVIGAAQTAGVRKIVFTSIQGAEQGTDFSPVVQSNRTTEADVRASGLQWVIGRNGIYVEADVEYVDRYEAIGEVVNSAGDGKCGYTTHSELAYAYARMLAEPKHDGHTYNLHGEPISQAALAAFLNDTFGTQLVYRAVSVDAYRADRTAELGEFFGPIIAGIYAGIRIGAFDNPSDFEAAAGRPHQSWSNYFGALKNAAT